MGGLVRGQLRRAKYLVIFVMLLAMPGMLATAIGQAPAEASQVPWSPTQAPLPSSPLPDGKMATSMDLVATSCSSAAFCVAVGWVSDDPNEYSTFPLAETYSGGAWNPSVLPVPADADSTEPKASLQAVSCGADGSCAAVGVYYAYVPSTQADNQSGLLEQLNAGTWTPTAAPLPNGPNSALVNLNSISCSDALTCVAVGQVSDDQDSNVYGAIYSLTSAGWQLEVAPVPSHIGVLLNGVSCPDDGDCVAVGAYQDTNDDWYGVILTLASGVWTFAEAPPPSNLVTGSTPDIDINAVDCPEVNSCIAGGFYAATGTMDAPLLLEEQSGTWTPLEAPVPSDSQSDTLASINGVYCPALGACVATGYYFTNWSAGEESGMIETESAGSWTAASAPLPSGPTSTAQVAESPKVQGAQATSVSISSSLAGVACGVDGFCASAGQLGAGNGLLETGAWSGLPTVTGVSPAQSPIAGGQTVTVSGSNFGADSVVSFGGTPASTSVISTTQLSAIAPASPVARVVDVTVSTGGIGSRANDSDRFTYVGVQNRVAGFSRPNATSSPQSADVAFLVPWASCAGIPKGSTQSVDEGARLRTLTGGTIGGVTVSCVGPKATYSALLEINGTVVPSTVTVSAGQKVSVAITVSATNSTVTITRGTQKQTASGPEATVTGEDLGSFAAGCDTSNCLSVPKVTVTSFSGASLDGVSPAASGATLVNLEDAAGQLEVAGAKTGTSTFKATWKYSCSKTTNC